MKRWNEILDHQRVLDVLAQALESDRMHHAYLFTGPPGIGKFTVAHALAAVLNCENRRAGSFAHDCGNCSTCRRISERQHPDVFFIEPPKKIIKIEQIRQLQKASISAPYEGRFRVVLIDDAHTMSEEAANALLKTLEEPPERMLLTLITDQPHRLLDTIISRCQRMRFGALDEEIVADALGELVDDDVDQTLLPVAAGYGEGSLGRSLSMIRSGMLADREEFLNAVFELDGSSPRAWLELADQLSDSSGELEHRIDILTVFMRDLMLYQRADSSRVVNSDLMQLLASQAPRFSLETILATLQALMAARRRLNHHVNSTLLAEDLLARLQNPGSRGLVPTA